MLLPEDFGRRVAEFVAGRTSFPFVARDELMCMMFLYGTAEKVKEEEIGDVAVLAERTASQIGAQIEKEKASSARLDGDFVRSKLVNRQLQIGVENESSPTPERVAADPSIIMELFSAHVATLNQDYYFELYGPLKVEELSPDIQTMLAGRMVMVGYNRKSREEIRLDHPMIPVYMWFKAHAGANP